MLTEEAIARVESVIRTLRNKFLESPFTFYTESAMHCYLYHLLYQGETFKQEFEVRIGKHERIKTITLHNEYPTLGKFYKQKDGTLIPCEEKYVEVENRRLQPSRGAYDLAIVDLDSSMVFKRQRTSIAIELALNEVDTSLWHLRNDLTKIIYEKDRVERGYILYFIRREELSPRVMLRLPELRRGVVDLYEKSPDPRVRILYLEAPNVEKNSEVYLPKGWKM